MIKKNARNRWLVATSITVFGALAAGTAEGALIASDSFSTTTNGAGGTYNTSVSSSRVYGQSPTAGLSGFTGAWGNSDSGTTANWRVQTSGLSHGLLQGTAVAGSAITGGASGNPRTTQRQINSIPASPIYAFSLLLRSPGAGANNQNVASAGLTGSLALTSSVTTAGGVRVGVSGANLVLWVGNTSTTLLSNYTANEEYFVTVEIDDTGDVINDEVTANVWASANTTLASPTATASINNQNITGSLGYFSLVMSDSRQNTTTVDEFRFGTSVDDVVVPEPASLTAIALVGTLLRRRRD